MRLLLCLFLLGVSAFCSYGFLAAREPMEGNQGMYWQTGYLTVSVLALAAAIRLMMAGRTNRSDGTE